MLTLQSSFRRRRAFILPLSKDSAALEMTPSMLHWNITLPDLEPTLAVVRKWCIENNNNLIINHIVLIFKKFLHDNRSNHSRMWVFASVYASCLFFT